MKKTVFRIRWRWFFAAAAAVTAFCLLEGAAEPAVESAAKYQAELHAAEILNDAVMQELETSRDIISGAVLINYTDDGKIASVVADGYVFSFVKEHITKALIESLSDARTSVTSVPLGVFSGIPILSGAGPGVPIYISLLGAPKTEISGSLVSSGINQSIYRVVLTYTVQMTALVPFYSVSAEVSDEVVLAEIVFSGEVPQVVINK